MTYVIILALLAVVVDVLFIWAWRRRNRTGAWPSFPLKTLRNRVSSMLHRLPDASIEWLQPKEEPHPEGWRGYLAEISLAVALVVLGAYVLILRPNVPSPDQQLTIGPWLAWIHALRESALSSGLTWAILLPLGMGVLLTYAIRRKQERRALERVAGLGLALLFGLEAQLALVNGKVLLAAILYLGLTFTVWRWWRSFGTDLEDVWRARGLSKRLEFSLVGLIFVLSAATRLYGIGNQPYGVEGDESKWTIEVVQWMLNGREAFSSQYHYTSLPVSFYMQAPFHYLAGPGITSARMTVAVASVLAGLLFYFLLRRTIGTPVALVGFFLLAVSPADVIASRLGNVESHVKLWAVLPLFFLFIAFDQRRTAWFALSGIALALALITYDTLAPLLGLVALLFVVEAIRNRKAGATYWKGFLALSIPLAFTLPKAIGYLLGRRPYYDLASKGWSDEALLRLFSGAGDLLKNIFVLARPDFLFVRSGPLLENAIAPFFVMGLVVALLRFRSRGPLLLLSWFFLFSIPVPVMLDSPMFRVIYPGWPAYYGIAALAIVLCVAVLIRPLLRQPLLSAVIVAGACLLFFNNLYIYLYELEDPQDRVNRRDAAELVLQQVNAGDIVFTPYAPNAGHVLDDEQSLIRLYLRSSLDASELDHWYRPVESSDLIHDLSVEFPGGNVAVVSYKDEATPEPTLDPLQNALVHCYAAHKIEELDSFSVYTISSRELIKPRCVAPNLSLGVAQEQTASSGEVNFDWQSDFPVTGPELACQAIKSGTYLLQPEDFTPGPGWTFETRFAPIPEGEGKFLADGLGNQYAVAELPIVSSDTYAVWMLSYRRKVDDWPVRIDVGDAAFSVSSQPDTLDEWVWERAGTVQASQSTIVRLHRPYGGPDRDFVSAFIGGVLLTQDLEFDPGQASIWVPGPRVTVPVENGRSGHFRQAFDPGTYQCSLVAENDVRLVDPWGQPGASSENILFSIEP